ncbi:MAG: phosphoglycerate dehydrogenase [Phycisphaeraceae bacterium]|nr:phosphoglycerate dehydrogenase [Phycisphaeraceae bacterium]
MSTSYPLDQIKVVLAEGIHPTAEESLREAGFSVESLPGALNGAELIEVAGDAHMLGIRSRSHCDEAFFKEASRLWAVGCFCIGSNQVDLGAAARRGVAVFNAPFSNTRSVAEMTIAEIVALHRGLVESSARMHEGVWTKTASGRHEVRGRTLGIVGFGRIGSQVSILAEAMGMRVLYHDTAHRLPLGNAAAVGSLDELLRSSDVVTLHVPATSETEDLITARELALMKPGSFLINNARGSVVDVAALSQTLREGRLAGAAVDVFPKEPGSNTESFESPLRGLPNVILTPHVGGSTEEAQKNIAIEVAGKLVRLMNNGSTATALNMPEAELPNLHEAHHRILHIHHNVPGVLSAMHRMIAAMGVNIAAEHLQSDTRLGYVILDVNASHGDRVVEALRSIPETIRVRAIW